MAGILGLPFPNGLIPQAPFHTESLCVTEVVQDEPASNSNSKPTFSFRAAYVVEQRLSNLAQGLLTLVAMTGPLLTVLHLIPQGVLAGLFFIMGFQALEANGITAKLLFLFRDEALTPPNHPLRRGVSAGVRRGAVWVFVLVELVGFGATFAITQTVAAVGFPVFIFLLIPLRAMVLPKLLTKEELAVLDEPTASPFTMESVGGVYGGSGSGSGSMFLDADEEGGGRSASRSASVSGAEEEGRRERPKVGKDKEKEGVVVGRAGGATGLSEEELAELGEGGLAGGVRRRLSTVNREEAV